MKSKAFVLVLALVVFAFQSASGIIGADGRSLVGRRTKDLSLFPELPVSDEQTASFDLTKGSADAGGDRLGGVVDVPGFGPTRMIKAVKQKTGFSTGPKGPLLKGSYTGEPQEHLPNSGYASGGFAHISPPPPRGVQAMRNEDGLGGPIRRVYGVYDGTATNQHPHPTAYILSAPRSDRNPSSLEEDVADRDLMILPHSESGIHRLSPPPRPVQSIVNEDGFADSLHHVAGSYDGFALAVPPRSVKQAPPSIAAPVSPPLEDPLHPSDQIPLALEEPEPRTVGEADAAAARQMAERSPGSRDANWQTSPTAPLDEVFEDTKGILTSTAPNFATAAIPDDAFHADEDGTDSNKVFVPSPPALGKTVVRPPALRPVDPYSALQPQEHGQEGQTSIIKQHWEDPWTGSSDDSRVEMRKRENEIFVAPTSEIVGTGPEAYVGTATGHDSRDASVWTQIQPQPEPRQLATGPISLVAPAVQTIDAAEKLANSGTLPIPGLQARDDTPPAPLVAEPYDLVVTLSPDEYLVRPSGGVDDQGGFGVQRQLFQHPDSTLDLRQVKGVLDGIEPESITDIVKEATGAAVDDQGALLPLPSMQSSGKWRIGDGDILSFDMGKDLDGRLDF